jgi:hypothetical protein
LHHSKAAHVMGHVGVRSMKFGEFIFEVRVDV